jgi:ligand-binding sensor domain-containing protein
MHGLDSREQLWIGTFQNGMFVYNTRTGIYKQLKAGNGVKDITVMRYFA